MNGFEKATAIAQTRDVMFMSRFRVTLRPMPNPEYEAELAAQITLYKAQLDENTAEESVAPFVKAAMAKTVVKNVVDTAAKEGDEPIEFTDEWCHRMLVERFHFFTFCRDAATNLGAFHAQALTEAAKN